MRKPLAIVALMSALPCAASAASVTLYGVVDVHVSHFRHSDGNVTSMNSGGLGGSRFGLRGEEELSESLAAIFVLEGGYNTNTGKAGQGGRLFGRQAYAGLRSRDYGTLIAGRLQGLGYEFGGVYDPMMIAPGAVIGSLVGEGPRPWMHNPLADPARMDNAILYKSPNLNGFELGYQHGFRESPGNNGPRGNRFDLASLTYAKGALRATYSFGRSSGTTYTTAATSRQTEHALGVRYGLSWATLFGTYQLRKTSGYSGNDQAWQIGARVPVTKAGSVHVAYGQASNDTPQGALDSTADWGVRSWAIGYVHSLSKRTTLYTYFKQLDNRGNARQGIFPGGGLPAPSRLEDRVTAFGVGMQHRF